MTGMRTDDLSNQDQLQDGEIILLLHKKITGDALSEEEERQLTAWKNRSADNIKLFNKLSDHSSFREMLKTWHAIEQSREKNKARFLERLADNENKNDTTARFLQRRIFRYAAAAAAILGIGIYLLEKRLPDNHAPTPPIVSGVPVINPGHDGAVLTLADGSQLVLDSAGNGVVANQNGTKVMLQNGQLLYDQAFNNTGSIVYNTVSTPKGRQFRLVLPDGSRVWLNAASSIKYPTSFSTQERRVKLMGEAYFEIEKNESAPFRITAGDATEIEVLGTSFNVNAYTNENAIRTTLLQGAVKLLAYNQTAMLKPGQQATVKTSSGRVYLENKVDTDKVMAWKNGLFNFEDASLEEVMRQLERWYDIEVVYEKGIPPIRFGGEINKQNTLQDVLQILEGSKVHFQLKGRKLIVMP
jgi:ferric-dicitrate binding protein FerR (iron transport regulator)